VRSATRPGFPRPPRNCSCKARVIVLSAHSIPRPRNPRREKQPPCGGRRRPRTPDRAWRRSHDQQRSRPAGRSVADKSARRCCARCPRPQLRKQLDCPRARRATLQQIRQRQIGLDHHPQLAAMRRLRGRDGLLDAAQELWRKGSQHPPVWQNQMAEQSLQLHHQSPEAPPPPKPPPPPEKPPEPPRRPPPPPPKCRPRTSRRHPPYRETGK
jgi:hypothetical protein